MTRYIYTCSSAACVVDTLIIDSVWLAVKINVLGSIYRNFEEGKQFQIEQLGAQNGVVNTLTRADLKTKYKYFEWVYVAKHSSYERSASR